MAITNLNYYYYVGYYNLPKNNFLNPNDPDCENNLREHNQTLTDYTVNAEKLMTPLDKCIAPHDFDMKTVYPGLLIGTGLSHSFGGKGEAKLGICLDYTTGMPYIPGSSVKGTLRSAFCDTEYIRNLLPDEKSIDIAELEARIFGNSIDKDRKQYSVSANEQDTFYDAVITSTGKLLATDFITPHRQNKKLMELAEPNPITMIRIRPGVKLKFQFHLKETLGITPDQKLKIFQTILQDIGIGAKTNVGYGSLEPDIGVCECCGKPTGRNNRTGEYYPLCNRCSSLRDKNGVI